MQKTDRKALAQAYRERKPEMGVFAVRCTPTGQIWVGHTRDLHAQKSRIWLSLKTGAYSFEGMQKAWQSHGHDTFTFERLAQLEAEEVAFPDAKLKELRSFWCDRLDAKAI